MKVKKQLPKAGNRVLEEDLSAAYTQLNQRFGSKLGQRLREHTHSISRIEKQNHKKTMQIADAIF